MFPTNYYQEYYIDENKEEIPEELIHNQKQVYSKSRRRKKLWN